MWPSLGIYASPGGFSLSGCASGPLPGRVRTSLADTQNALCTLQGPARNENEGLLVQDDKEFQDGYNRALNQVWVGDTVSKVGDTVSLPRLHAPEAGLYNRAQK